MVNVADKIKKALFDKGWTVKKLCGEIEVSEQGYKHMVDNNSWKLQNLIKIAQVLELPVAYLVTEDETELKAVQVVKAADGGSFGSEVLNKIVEEFGTLKAQLSIKDRQIDGLQRTVDALLGRPSEKSFRKPVAGTGRIIELFPAFGDKNLKLG